MKESSKKKRRLLFVHSNEGDFTSRPNQKRLLDSRVRRHVMVDIGKSRRKPSKDRQFVTLIWQAQKNTRKDGDLKDGNDVSLQAPANDLLSLDTAVFVAPYVMPPILYPLSTFEKEWGEDSFSAYGFTLIMVLGKNALGPAYSTDTFWFPFAFRKSAFLRHYQQMFTSPDILIQLYRQSARELTFLALERSLMTIQCVESRLASSDTSRATSDSVISAVLALVCYNLTNLDFDQAMIHVRGIWTVIEARGGISTLEDNQDLLLMVSWVDVTAALLHDTRPLFPLFTNMSGVFHCPGLEMLPAPLISIIKDESMQDGRFVSIMSCMGDLNALAALLQVELAAQGDAVWDDEEKMSFLINPVTHRLLDLKRDRLSELETRWDVISEALWLGAIIWIIRLKRRCHSYPGTARARISTLLNSLSRNFDTESIWSNSPGLQTVRLWLLVICSVSEPSDQDRTTSTRLLATRMREQGLVSWDEVMLNICQMPWIDIYRPPCAKHEHLVD